ncbi:hypothetical protein COOONC_26840, partial [Cooperia oncophora]
DQGKCRDWYEKNALVLQVFFETLKYESYKETPSYGCCALIMMLGLYFASCGTLKIRPDDGDLEEDERIKDVEEVKKELDKADKHDKMMNDEIDDGDEDLDEDLDEDVEESHDNNNEKKPKL